MVAKQTDIKIENIAGVPKPGASEVGKTLVWAGA